jgi:hypothetical protein
MPSSPRELVLSTLELEGPCDIALDATLARRDTDLGGELASLVGGLTDTEAAGALLALSEHASVLRLIWEAHARGAIALPPTLARRVVQARRSIPGFLGANVVMTATMPPSGASKQGDELSY